MVLLEQPPMGSSQIDWLIAGIVRPEPAPGLLGSGSAWDTVLNRITVWEREPGELEDEGVRPPAVCVLRLALEFARELRLRGIDAPTAMVPNGDGGMVFRWKDGQTQWTVEFEEDGFVESYLVLGGRVQCRHGLQAAGLGAPSPAT